MNEAEAFNYLRPLPTSFWQWGDDGRVLLWADGRTIAFLPELHAAAGRLARAGLPPFGCLALAFAATRRAWKDDERQRGTLVGYVRTALSADAELPAMVQDLLRDGMTRLEALANLPEDLRRGPEARALLVEMFFEGVPPTHTPPGVGQVVRILSQRVPEFDDAGLPLAAERASDALAILKTLAACRLLTDSEAIRLRQRTSLEQTPKAPDLHISERVRGLLNSLRGDPQLGGLAKLARAVLAVIATPRRLQPETELPLGGFSDISNRGPLDRLLLTELAHDDLTLAVRVALNEALYLRRESPRTPQNFTRVLLIDTGIRLWGVPRVFATAVALAFAASMPKEASLVAWTAHGKTLRPVDLATRDGLIEHLEQLEPLPHPGAALPALAKSLQAISQQDAGENETIVITHPDVRADAEFQRLLHQADLYPLMTATVAGSGRFELTAVSVGGQKPLSQATLNLQEVHEPPATQAPLIALEEDLPAYCRLITSPFRLPLRSDMNHAVASQRHGLIGIAGRALLHWPRPGHPRQLATVPSGNFLGLGLFEEQGTVVTTIWDPIDRALRLTSVRLGPSQKVVNQRVQESGPPIAVAGHNGVVLLFHREKVEAYSFDRAVRIATVSVPTFARHLGGRFVEGASSRIHAVAYDGASLQLVGVALPSNPLAVFSRVGAEGPLGLYADGSVQDSQGMTLVAPAAWSKGLQRHTHQISNDGNRLIVSDRSSGVAEHMGIDLTEPKPAWRPLKEVKPLRFLLGRWADYALDQSLPVRRRMRGICVTGGDLVLVSHRYKSVTLQSRDGTLAYSGRFVSGNHGYFVEFKELGAGHSMGLEIADWKDGSRAWIDPRGLLHLRSSEPSLPELSVLLHDAAHHMTAWLSSGRTFGPDHYLEESATGTRDELQQYLLAFVEVLR